MSYLDDYLKKYNKSHKTNKITTENDQNTAPEVGNAYTPDTSYTEDSRKYLAEYLSKKNITPVSHASYMDQKGYAPSTGIAPVKRTTPVNAAGRQLAGAMAHQDNLNSFSKIKNDFTDYTLSNRMQQTKNVEKIMAPKTVSAPATIKQQPTNSRQEILDIISKVPEGGDGTTLQKSTGNFAPFPIKTKDHLANDSTGTIVGSYGSLDEYENEIKEARAKDPTLFSKYVEEGKKKLEGTDRMYQNYLDQVAAGELEGGPVSDNEYKNAGLGGSIAAKYGEMTDTDRENYYYLLGSRENSDDAKKYMRMLEDWKINPAIAQKAYELNGSKNTAIENIGANLAAGLQSGVDAYKNIGAWQAGRDDVTATPVSAYYASMINENTPDGLKKDLYEVANSTGFNSLSYAAGAAGTALRIPGADQVALAAQGGGSAYAQAIREGRDPGQARMYADMSAADEYVTDKIIGGIGITNSAFLNMFKNSAVRQAAEQGLDKIGSPVARRIVLGLMDTGARAGGEASQEFLQTFSDDLYKRIAFGDAPEHTGNPLTDKEAWHNAWIGALNAAIMGAPGEVSGVYDAINDRTSYYNNMRSLYTPDMIQQIAEGADTSTPEGMRMKETAARLANKVENGQQLTDNEVSVLNNQVMRTIDTNVDNGETISADANSDHLRTFLADNNIGPAVQELALANFDPNMDAETYENGIKYMVDRLSQREYNQEDSKYYDVLPEAVQNGIYDAIEQDNSATTPSETATETKEQEPAQTKATVEPTKAAGVDTSLLGPEQAVIAQRAAERGVPINAFNTQPRKMQEARFNDTERYKAAMDLENKFIDTLSSDYGTAGKTAFKENYDRRLNISAYARGYSQVYNAGRYGLKQSEINNAITSLLSNEATENIYKSALKDREEALSNVPNYKERQEKHTGGVIESIPDAPKSVRNVMQALGEATGIDFIITDSRKYDNRLGNDNAIGGYDRTRGIITIDLASDNILGTTSHELTHWIQDYSREGYQVYKDAAVQALIKSHDYSIDQLINNYMSKYNGSELEEKKGLSRDEILDEIVSDESGAFLNDETFINEIVNKNRSLGERIYNFISSMLDAIKELVNTSSLRNAAKALKEDQKRYEDARDKWYKALSKAAETMETKQYAGETKESVNEAIRNQLDLAEGEGETITMPGNSMDPKLAIKGTKEERQKYREITNENIRAWSDIINRSDFESLGFPKGDDGYYILSPSTREGSLWQLTYFDDKGPVGHESYGGPEGHDINTLPRELYNKAKSGVDATVVYDDVKKKFADLGIKYQMKDNMDGTGDIEQTKQLIAVHNLSQQKLMQALNMDSNPMPSIAITKADFGWEKFGDISLILGKNSISPDVNNSNRIFGADAWTPMFPTLEYDIDRDAYQKIDEKIQKGMSGKAPEYLMKEAHNFIRHEAGDPEYNGLYGIIHYAENDTALKAAFLAEKGISVEDKTYTETKKKYSEDEITWFGYLMKAFDGVSEDEFLKDEKDMSLKELRSKYLPKMVSAAEERIKNSEGEEKEDAQRELKHIKELNWAFKANLTRAERAYRVLREGNPDVTTTKGDTEAVAKEIESKTDKTEYREWVEKTFAPVIAKAGIPNNKFYITAEGRRLSFDELHDPVTPENIVKAMLAEAGNGRGLGIHGRHDVRALKSIFTPEYRSLNDVIKDSGRLKKEELSEYTTREAELNNRIDSVIEKIKSNFHEWYNDNDFAMNEVFKEIGAKKKFNAADVWNEFQKRGFFISQEDAKEIKSIINDVKALPAEMFEAKPERAIAWREFLHALVPVGTDETLIERMKQRGIQDIIYYDPSVEGDRTEKLKSLNDVRFQLKDVDQPANPLRYELKIDQSIPYQSEIDSKMRTASDALANLIVEAKNVRPSDASISKLVKKTVEEYSSDVDTKLVKEQITRLYTVMSLRDDPHADDIIDAANAIAAEIIEEATIKDPVEEKRWSDFKKELRQQVLYVSKDMAKDIDPEGMGHLIKSMAGRLTVTSKKEQWENDGAHLYEHMQGLFPEYFPDPTPNNERDAARMVIEKRLTGEPLRQPNAPAPGADFEEAQTILGEEIIKNFFDHASAGTKQAYMDKYNKAVTALRNDISVDLNKYKIQMQDELARKKAELDKKYSENYYTVDEYMKLKDQLNKQKITDREAINKRVQEHRDKWMTRHEKSMRIKNIERNMNYFYKLINNPTDKNHLEAPIAAGIQDLFATIDTTTGKSGAADLKRKALYEELKRKNFNGALANFKLMANAITNADGVLQTEDGRTVYLTVDPDLIDNVKRIADYIEQKAQETNEIIPVRKMSPDKVKEIDDLISSIRKMVEEKNRTHTLGKNVTIQRIANETFSDLEYRNKAREFAPGGLNFIQKMLTEGMLDSYTFFNGIGKSGDRIYNSLREARDKKAINIQQARDYIDSIKSEIGVTGKELREWSETPVKVTVGRREMTTTVGQLMNLYLLNKRPQARKHIYGNENLKGDKEISRINGGIKFDKVPGKVFYANDADPARGLTESDVVKLTNQLTPKQKAFADRLQKFMQNQTSMWGNEVAMNLYGYTKFNEDSYWPIHTYGAVRATDSKQVETDGFSVLKNKGWTKATVDTAMNPLVVEDAMRVFMKQIDEMSSYNAYLPALDDMTKWLNYQDVSTSMKIQLMDKLSDNSVSYINNLLKDLNGIKGENKGWDYFWKSPVSLAKGAAVGANISVAIQQPFSIFRATGAIEPKYLITGAGHTPAERAREYEKAKTYAPIILWKDWGGPDIGAGSSLRDVIYGSTNVLEELRNKSMILAEIGDTLTWKTLWMASEDKVKAEYKDLTPGSDEFYRKSAEIFNGIIDQTQVVDSVLNRVEMMKDKNGIAQTVTAFMSEPMKTYDMVYRAINEYFIAKQELKNGGKTEQRLKRFKEAKGRILTHTAIIIMTIAATNAAKSLVGALRDKDKDKKYGERWSEKFLENFLQDLNPLNYIPYLKEIQSLIEGNEADDLSTSGLTKLVKAMQETGKAIKGDSKYGWGGILYKLLSAGATIGLPTQTISRDIGAIYDEIAADADNKSMQYRRNRYMYDMYARSLKTDSNGNPKLDENGNPQYSYTNLKMFVTEALKAYAAGENELGDKIMEDLKKRIPEEYIENQMESLINDEPGVKEAAQALAEGHQKDYETIRNDLISGGYGEELVDAKIQNRVNSYVPSPTDIATKIAAGEDWKTELDQRRNYLMSSKGLSQKEAEEKTRSAIKNALTTKYKPEYIANPDRRSEIMTALYKVVVYGQQVYTAKDFKSWK